MMQYTRRDHAVSQHNGRWWNC